MDNQPSPSIDHEEADHMTTRDANAPKPPVQASDPRSLTIDRGSADSASSGASADAEAAAERATDA